MGRNVVNRPRNPRKNEIPRTVRGKIRLATLVDPLSPIERSIRMAKVKGARNRSTELHVAGCLIRSGIRGWKRQPTSIAGKPDFLFAEQRLALFIDGCFWHGCGRCNRNLPRARREFWRAKIDANRTRDRKVRDLLRSQGYSVMRVWEHSLRDGRWLLRLRTMLAAAVD